MMFKSSIGVLPLPVSAPFQYNSVIHTHNTRRNKFFHTPIGRSEFTYRTFSYRGAHIWNYIFQNVRIDVSYACFKNLVKTHILAHPITHFRLNIKKKELLYSFDLLVCIMYPYHYLQIFM